MPCFAWPRLTQERGSCQSHASRAGSEKCRTRTGGRRASEGRAHRRPERAESERARRALRVSPLRDELPIEFRHTRTQRSLDAETGVFPINEDLQVIRHESCQSEQRKSGVRLAHGSHDPHLATVITAARLKPGCQRAGSSSSSMSRGAMLVTHSSPQFVKPFCASLFLS